MDVCTLSNVTELYTLRCVQFIYTLHFSAMIYKNFHPFFFMKPYKYPKSYICVKSQHSQNTLETLKKKVGVDCQYKDLL